MIEAIADSDSDSDVDLPDAVGLLAEQFLALHRQGLTPDIDEYCSRNPKFADRIRNLFPTLLMVEQCGIASGDTPSTKSEFVSPSCPEQIGDYKIIREVGRGGMGIVYEAEQQSLGRRVALKVLPTSAALSSSTIERFRRESRAAARLHHSNIVPVFGVGEQDGLHYYVMQFIQGVGLDEILLQLADSKRGLLFQGTEFQQQDTQATETGTNPSTLAARSFSSSVGERHSNGSQDRIYWHRVALIGMQLANALHFAHSQGVLHRDLKPANVMLDTEGIVWLTDFGLAQATDDANLTRSGDIVGTLRYLAPERLRGECSRQSDVYGLGITLYELLTFVPAFAETDRAKLIHQIVQQDPKRPTSINRNIPRDLETIISKAIEKEAARRYASASELADDLSRFLGDRPIRARRVVLIEQVWRWCRRNPTVTALSSTVCLLMLGLTIAWGMFSWVKTDRDRARTAERLAEQARTAANRAEAIAQARSHFAQAFGYRHSTEPGRKSKVLSQIGLALAFDPPEEIRFELRNEAIAALAQTDVKLGRVSNDWLNAFYFDQPLEHFVRLETSGAVSVIQIDNDRLIGQFVPKTTSVRSALLSDQGRFLVLKGNEGESLEVWNVSRGERVVGPLPKCWAFDIAADETMIAVSLGDGQMHFYDLATGAETQHFQVDGEASVLAYSPDNRHLAVVLKNKQSIVRIVEAASGRAAQELLTEGSILDCQWHPDGSRLAMGFSRPGNVEVWDIRSRRKVATMIGHTQHVGRVGFNKRGDCLTSGSWDGTIRVWETTTGNQIAAFTGGGMIHSGHESVVGFRLIEGGLQAVELDRPVGFDCLSSSIATEMSRYHCGDTTADGRWLIAGTENSLEFWDLVERRNLAILKQPFTSQVFLDSQRERFISITPQGMQHVPIQFDGPRCRVGTPILVGGGDIAVANAHMTPDGQLWAIIGKGKARIQRASGELVREFVVESQHEGLCISPDGKFLVTYGWHSPTVSVWETETGSLIKQFTEPAKLLSFTPDSNQLITCTRHEYTFRNMADWKIVRRIERLECAYPSLVAYSPRGDLVALELTWGVIHLLRTDTFETIALLESPKKGRPTQFRFIGDDNTLFAFHHLSGEIHFWKINELSEKLVQLGLGWQDNSSNASKEHGDRLPGVPSSTGRLELELPNSDNPIDLEAARELIARAEKQLSEKPDSLLAANNLAWRLLIGPTELRDVNRAVKLLEKAMEAVEMDNNSRNTLAIAYYRSERYAEAAELLRANLGSQDDMYLGYDLYFLAMSYWKLDEPNRARDMLEWAERMFRLKSPQEPITLRELEAFQKEARELIQAVDSVHVDSKGAKLK